VSYELSFDKVPTGRTHQVNMGGVIQTQEIQGPDGEPEVEYVLSAIVDGHAVALERYSAGYVEHMVGRDDTAIDSSSSSSSQPSGEQPAPAAAEQTSPPAGEGTAGEGAQQQPPAAQPAG